DFLKEHADGGAPPIAQTDPDARRVGIGWSASSVERRRTKRRAPIAYSRVTTARLTFVTAACALRGAHWATMEPRGGSQRSGRAALRIGLASLLGCTGCTGGGSSRATPTPRPSATALVEPTDTTTTTPSPTPAVTTPPGNPSPSSRTTPSTTPTTTPT